MHLFLKLRRTMNVSKQAILHNELKSQLYLIIILISRQMP